MDYRNYVVYMSLVNCIINWAISQRTKLRKFYRLTVAKEGNPSMVILLGVHQLPEPEQGEGASGLIAE